MSVVCDLQLLSLLGSLAVLKLGKVQSCWGSHYQYSYIRDEVNILMKHTNGLVEPFGLASGVGTILSTYFA